MDAEYEQKTNIQPRPPLAYQCSSSRQQLHVVAALSSMRKPPIWTVGHFTALFAYIMDRVDELPSQFVTVANGTLTVLGKYEVYNYSSK